MTIDERLEKLTERHEALTQTVEITASMQQANERQIAQLAVLMGQALESITRLPHIAEAHEHRLDDLDNRQ